MSTGSLQKGPERAEPGGIQILPGHDKRRAVARVGSGADPLGDRNALLVEEVIRGNTYDKYATANPVERRLMKGFFRALERSLPETIDGPVLEVGTGEGEVASWVGRRYPDASITGLDLPDARLAGEWSRRHIQACFGDIANLPFVDRQFGLVLAIEVLEHVPDPAAALAEIVRVARGHVVVSVPREPLWRVANMARGKYLSALGNTPGHVQHWSRRSFVAMVRSHLELLGVQSPPPWTMVAARVPA